LTGVVVWLYPAEIVALVGQPDLRPFLYLLPLGIWITSSYTAVQFWSTRQKRFGAIATTRVAQAIGGTGTQLGLGWMSFNPSGLLLGHLVTSGMGLVGLSRETLRKDCASLRTISWPGMCRMLRQYDRFPKFSTFEAFANSAGTQLPVIIIAAWVVGPEAGYLMLAARVMAAPMGLIGGAVAQVYLSQAPQEHRAGRLDSFTCQVIGGLAKSGIGPLIFVGILAPVVFPLVFGQNWGRAGALLAWMTPWFIMQFLVAPVSMALHIAGKQQIALGLQLFGLVLRVGMVVGAGWFTYSSIGEVYAISGFFFYCLYLYVVTLLLGIKPSQLFRAVSSGFLIISLWAVVGIGAAIALRTIASVSP
jgi:O-antigen/teichoic acid export membrane protein